MVANKRTRRGQARTELLAAALRLIATSGLNSFSMRELSEESGVSLGTFTHHFSSRANMIREAIGEHSAACVAIGDTALIQAATQTGAAAVATLRAALLDLYGDRIRALVIAELRTRAVNDADVARAATAVETTTTALVTAAYRHMAIQATPARVRDAGDILVGQSVRLAIKHTAAADHHAAVRRHLSRALPVPR